MVLYIHPLRLGTFSLAVLLGIIPNRDKIFILLKVKCPRLRCHIMSSTWGCSTNNSS